jgi:hypothetical protein
VLGLFDVLDVDGVVLIRVHIKTELLWVKALQDAGFHVHANPLVEVLHSQRCGKVVGGGNGACSAHWVYARRGVITGRVICCDFTR